MRCGIYRERETSECRTPPPPPLHRPTTAMSELGGHCTSPPYQLKTVMIIGILGSATRLLPFTSYLSLPYQPRLNQ
ncbi:hypothetical protein HanXRQr2_Chr13g0597411 [Helianthus annuus]|uniref:Uncharacterized protein n=1 Tax=Helianthus annuus TaxID=4232 RepID=A0A251SU79_HELAN|nr:hypothetical protein HanXRQr2_Chr13g0597411 [Helianthus annuus]KAJ0477579.1 hypothetical protein HanHA300_Chr13g0490181 [Helianthus annuus]KAJ0498408.1 hypothetical protein HanHA89_Chr13g0522291 [Helianthus annuus]KAJ0664419.1 hypothetical protein HanLR1_Chr13g0492231 [Helianthus annuus]KAJ0671878.1 hypothetical protein HanOQP8_Chr13g0490671 [Helianthus annuus]